jgi:hypothetical protein
MQTVTSDPPVFDRVFFEFFSYVHIFFFQIVKVKPIIVSYCKKGAKFGPKQDGNTKAPGMGA